MALPSFLQRKTSPPSAPPADGLGDETAPVQQARIRARRRLIGALVLLAIGVVVFPMLFETQPRPLPRDVPIELARRDGATSRAAASAPRPLANPEAPVPEPASPASAPAAAAPAVAVSSMPVQAEPTLVQASATAASPVAGKPSAPSGTTTDKAEKADKPVPPRAEPAPAVTRKAESDRAQALLEARAPPAPASATDARAGRFVVQVGAYTDAATLREVRAKVEKLGLKTYTQSVETEAGVRTRVRVGPFATRPEAEAASGKLKGAGLPGNVLVL